MNLLRTLGRQILFVLGWLVLSSVAVATESVTYYHNDAAGTPVLATDANGNLLWKETYLPYGKKQTNAAASADNRIGFTGKPYDNATGLSYMGARYYDPLIGRFNGIDPKGFDPANLQSFNRYAYANNNPYKFVDPDGRWAVPVIVALGLWVGEQMLPQQNVPWNSGQVTPTSLPDMTGALKAGVVGIGIAGTIRQAGVREALSAGAEKGAKEAVVQFGKVENQISHTFRHVEKAGFDRAVVQDAVKQDLSRVAESLSNGLYNGSVVVNGTKLDYSAFKFLDGTINVGRITPPKP